MTGVVLVAALADNRVIGHDGGIPWRIPSDFAHFKRVTLGHPLVLGRTTFEGIGEPLPDRTSIVVTTDPAWSHDGVLVARTVEEALSLGAELGGVVMVGGGSRIYADALPHATGQILTFVHLEPEGDTYYPDYDPDDWHETAREEHVDHEPAYDVVWLERTDNLTT